MLIVSPARCRTPLYTANIIPPCVSLVQRTKYQWIISEVYETASGGPGMSAARYRVTPLCPILTPRMSLGLDVGVANRARVFLVLAADMGTEVLAACADDLEPLGGELRRDVWCLERGDQHGGELGERVRRRPRGSDDAEECRCLEIPVAGLDEGRHVGQRLDALARGDSERPELAGAQLFHDLVVVGEHGGDVATDERGDGGRAARIGHVGEVDAGGMLEHLAGDVLRGGRAHRRVGELARSRGCRVDEFLQGTE